MLPSFGHQGTDSADTAPPSCATSAPSPLRVTSLQVALRCWRTVRLAPDLSFATFCSLSLTGAVTDCWRGGEVPKGKIRCCCQNKANGYGKQVTAKQQQQQKQNQSVKENSIPMGDLSVIYNLSSKLFLLSFLSHPAASGHVTKLHRL